MSKPEVRKFLVASLVHIPEKLRSGVVLQEDVFGGSVSEGEYGFWVWVPDEPALPDNVPVNSKEEGVWDHPWALAALLKARELGCDYINFDRDGEAVEGLQVFSEEA